MLVAIRFTRSHLLLAFQFIVSHARLSQPPLLTTLLTTFPSPTLFF